MTGCAPLAINGTAKSAALCLDFAVKNTTTEIKDRLAVLGGTSPFEIKCSSEPNVSCDSNDRDAPATNTWSDDVVQHFNSWKREHPQSELYGMIQVIRQTGSSITFTVPISHRYQPGQRSGDFLYCFIDTAKVQLWNLVRGACVGASFFGFALFVLLLMTDYGARIKEQDRAFDTVDHVLSDVDVPYIRLNSDDQFIDFNAAFSKLIGYSSKVEAKDLSGSKFKYHLADDRSRAIYDDIEAARRNGDFTNPYGVDLRRRDNTVISVKVHGAAGPRPANPHGILLRPSASCYPLEPKVVVASPGLRRGEKLDRNSKVVNSIALTAM